MCYFIKLSVPRVNNSGQQFPYYKIIITIHCTLLNNYHVKMIIEDRFHIGLLKIHLMPSLQAAN